MNNSFTRGMEESLDEKFNELIHQKKDSITQRTNTPQVSVCLIGQALHKMHLIFLQKTIRLRCEICQPYLKC